MVGRGDGGGGVNGGGAGKEVGGRQERGWQEVVVVVTRAPSVGVLSGCHLSLRSVAFA